MISSSNINSPYVELMRIFNGFRGYDDHCLLSPLWAWVNSTCNLAGQTCQWASLQPWQCRNNTCPVLKSESPQCPGILIYCWLLTSDLFDNNFQSVVLFLEDVCSLRCL